MNDFLQKISAILVAEIYTISPIDVIPDVVPVAGQTDDVLVITVAIIYIIYISRQSKE